MYYCEFCQKDLCAKCTIEEAHEEEYIRNTDVVTCYQIHKYNKNYDMQRPDMDKDDLITENISCNEDLNGVNYCECGNLTKYTILNVMIVEKYSVKVVSTVQ